MKTILAALIIFSATVSAFADNYNSILVEGTSNSPTPVTSARVQILSGGMTVGDGTPVNIVPDQYGFFSTITYITTPTAFLSGSDFVIRFSSPTAQDETLSTGALTAVPFALTVRGDAQTGNQNVFGAYGNVGIGTSTPNHRLVISSAAGTSDNMLVISTGTSEVIRMTGGGEIYANKYYGDGSYLTGINACQDSSGNTLVGYAAGHSLSGIFNTYNVVVGYAAGYSLVSGAGNTFLGSQIAAWNVSGSSNIVIGDYEQLSSLTASNEVNIGGIIFGNRMYKTVGISTRVPQAALDVVSTGTYNTQFAQIWRNSNGIVSSMSATGVIMASKFVGDGSGLTGVTFNGSNVFNSSATFNGSNVFNSSTTFNGPVTSTITYLTGIVPMTVTVYTSGEGNYSPPAKARKLKVTLIGGGGGGGGSSNSAYAGGGGGGGGGGTSIVYINNPSGTYYYKVATGGLKGAWGGAGVGTAGSPGTVSSFTATYYATGGTGGSGNLGTAPGVGGIGGTGVGGTINIYGNSGATGTPGGGISGVGGNGGGTTMGGGGAGGSWERNPTIGADAACGNYYGGGGGGGSFQLNGGPGAPGIIAIEEYY